MLANHNPFYDDNSKVLEMMRHEELEEIEEEKIIDRQDSLMSKLSKAPSRLPSRHPS